MVHNLIRNTGSTKTFLLQNNKKHFNNIDWDAEYDGQEANIIINTNTDGIKDKYKVQLDNDDLMELMNIQSVPIPLDKRLEMDFQDKLQEQKFIEVPDSLTLPYLENKKITDNSTDFFTHLSSPRTNEEFIIPIPLNEKIKTHKSNSHSSKKKHYKTRKIYSKQLSNKNSFRKSIPKRKYKSLSRKRTKSKSYRK
jgi:hypothetical protein